MGPTISLATSTWPFPKSKRRYWESWPDKQRHQTLCSLQICIRCSACQYCFPKNCIEPRNSVSSIPQETPNHCSSITKSSGLQERVCRSPRFMSCLTVKMASKARNVESWRQSYERRYITSSVYFTTILRSMAPTDTRAARGLHLRSIAHRSQTIVKRDDLPERLGTVIGDASRVRVDYATQYLQ